MLSGNSWGCKLRFVGMGMTFEDVLEIKNGRNQRAVEDPNGKYPIYGSGGVMGYANDYICPENTVVIGRKGNINKPLFVDVPFWNVDTAFGLVAKKDVLLPRYLYYFCVNYDFEQHNKTVTIPSLTKADILKIKINLPTIEEQKRITERLKKIEAILELRNQELSALDDLIKARFVEMFGTVQNNVFQFAEGTLESISDEFFAGGDKPEDCITERDEAHPYPVFANGYENEGLQGYSAKCRVTRPAVTVSARGTIGYCFIREAGFTPVVRLVTIVPNNKVSPVFLKYAIDTMDIKSSGTSQAQLTVPDFKRERIIVPPAELQGQFAAFVAQIDKSKAVVQKALDETQLLFDSLMQEYFG